ASKPTHVPSLVCCSAAHQADAAARLSCWPDCVATRTSCPSDGRHPRLSVSDAPDGGPCLRHPPDTWPHGTCRTRSWIARPGPPPGSLRCGLATYPSPPHECLASARLPGFGRTHPGSPCCDHLPHTALVDGPDP